MVKYRLNFGCRKLQANLGFAPKFAGFYNQQPDLAPAESI